MASDQAGNEMRKCYSIEPLIQAELAANKYHLIQSQLNCIRVGYYLCGVLFFYFRIFMHFIVSDFVSSVSGLLGAFVFIAILFCVLIGSICNDCKLFLLFLHV